MQTLHEVTDEAKVAQIAESIECDGWQGADLVADGELLLTGVHRYAAMRQLDREQELDRYITDIRDLIADYDEQIDSLMADDWEWEEALEKVLDGMNAETREAYGIDFRG